MNKSAPPRQAAIVVKWPRTVDQAAARELLGQLDSARILATWAVDQATQIEAIATWGAIRNGAETALLASAEPARAGEAASEDSGRELARRLELLRATGVDVDIVHAGPGLTSGAWPRTLRALGIHGVVLEAAGQPGHVRALPFGVWNFAPQATTPAKRGLLSWLRPRRSPFVGVTSAAAVVTIDLQRSADAGARGARETGRVIEQAAAARAEGSIAISTVSQLARQFAQANEPRPQRSILRAA
jgi:hypothetical protein